MKGFKRLLALVLSAVLAVGMIPGTEVVYAEEGFGIPVEDENSEYYQWNKIGTDVYYKYENKILTLSGSGTVYDQYTLDSFLDEEVRNNCEKIEFLQYNANNIPSFNGFNKITSLIIPEGVKEIISDWSMSVLESVTFPSTIEWISVSSNEGFSKLRSVSFPNILKSKECTIRSSFDNCPMLEEVSIPKNVINIEESFNDCENLKRVDIPDSARNIYLSFDDGHSDLTIYGNNSSAAQSYARQNFIKFYNNSTGQTELNTDSKDWTGWTKIGTGVYYKYENTVLTISGSGNVYNKYSSDAFSVSFASDEVKQNCTDIVFSDYSAPNIPDIGGFNKITSLMIPEGVKWVDWRGPGSELLGLETLTIPSTVERICYFPSTPKLKNIAFPSAMEKNDVYIWEAFNDCELEEVVIPSNIGEIDNSFNDCSNLLKVDIPATVQNINISFQNCNEDLIIHGTNGSVAQLYAKNNSIDFFNKTTNKTEVNKPDTDWTGWTRIGTGVYCKYENKVLYLSGNGSVYSKYTKKDESFVDEAIKNECEKIVFTQYTADNIPSIDGFKKITSLSIPQGVKNTGWSGNLPNLEILSLPSSVEEVWYFNSLSKLSRIEFPESFSSNLCSIIQSFRDCPELKEINIPQNTGSLIGSFNNCISLKTADLPVSIYNISESFQNCSKELSIYGYINTKAEDYAKNNFINFVSKGKYQSSTSSFPSITNTDNPTEITSPIVNTTTTQTLAETVKKAQDNATINATVIGDGSIKREVFDAIKESDKTLTLIDSNVEWTFEGKDIIRESKDINVKSQVKIENEFKGENSDEIRDLTKDNNTLVVSFPENGTLPGMARIRVKLDSVMQNYMESAGLYVYYYNNKTGKPELIARNISVDKAGYVEFSISHCSDYLITSKPLDGVGETPVYRFYNKDTGDHFFTANEKERALLVRLGWDYEGISMIVAKAGGDPVYRLYNKNAGMHHYTKSSKEKDFLVNLGWNLEGVAWYTASFDKKTVYKLYNPNSGAHHFTVSEKEKDMLINLGWKYEGEAFKAI